MQDTVLGAACVFGEEITTKSDFIPKDAGECIQKCPSVIHHLVLAEGKVSC